MTNGHTRVAIVGAGIIGLAHAYLAARAGCKVTVFERSPAAGGASVRNFGMIWPIGQPPGEMHRLALRSREIWLELLRHSGIPYLPTGSLHVAYHKDEAEVGREFAERAAPLGYDCVWLDVPQTLRRTSAIRAEGLRGALWSSTEMTVDPRQVVARLPAFLNQRYGVTFHFNSAVREVNSRGVQTRAGFWESDAAIIASGDDFQTLFPEVFTDAGITRCKLQMMRTHPQPEGWSLGPSLAFGLTFRHYPSFAICESLPDLTARVTTESPHFDNWGIHVMASENASRQITLGDSHEYGLEVNVFDQSAINRLILDYARERLRVPRLEIAETWHGVYAKHPEKPYLLTAPCSNVRLVTVTSGIGMTLAFGLAEQTYRNMGLTT